MSWKSIEMQVALPRTQDAGKLQEQMSKQNQRFQESLAQSHLRQEQIRRKRVNEFEKINHIKINKEEESSENFSKERGKEQNPHQEQNINHPYLGKEIDFSG